MDREFIPYDIALELKELGFDELCFGWYHHKLIVSKEYSILEFQKCKNAESWITGKHCSAPLYQQAFRWLYQKNNIKGSIPIDSKSQNMFLKELIIKLKLNK